MRSNIRPLLDGTGTSRITCGDETVLTYNLPRLSGSRTSARKNYIHPLIAPGGACITEDAPSDHLHHRGIFWAWRRIIVGDKTADSWTGKNFAFKSPKGRGGAEWVNGADVGAQLQWIVFSKPVVAENTTVHLTGDLDHRFVQITIKLRALVPKVAIAGTSDAKGYGGPTIRFARSELIESKSEGRRLKPALGAVDTGATVDFSWHDRPEGFPSSIRTACTINGKPWTKWVLRDEPGMQNAAFPGATPLLLSTEHDLVIGFSLRIEA